MSTKKAKILQKINPKLLQVIPKLSGDDGSIIDLATDSTALEQGAKNLMTRFFKNHILSEGKIKNSNLEKSLVSNTVLNNDEVVGQIISEKLTASLEVNIHSSSHTDTEKPGGKWQKLKTELLHKMSEKWEEEYRKRVHESKTFYKDKECDTEEYGEEVDFWEKQKDQGIHKESGDCSNDKTIARTYTDSDEEGSESSGSDAEDEYSKSLESKVQSENDKKTEDIDSENTAGSNDEEFDGGNCSLVPAYQPGGGLLFGGSELTQVENDLPQNLLSPSLVLNITQSPYKNSLMDSNEKSESQFFNNNEVKSLPFETKRLFQTSESENNLFDLEDAFEFCSGKFPDTQDFNKRKKINENVGLETDNDKEKFKIESSDVINSNEKDNQKEFEKEDFVHSNSSTQKKLRKNIITYQESDSEDNLENHVKSNIDSNQNSSKNLRVKLDDGKDYDDGDDDVDDGNDNDDDDDDDDDKDDNDDKKELGSSTTKKKIRRLYFSDEEDEETGGNNEFNNEKEHDSNISSVNKNEEEEEENYENISVNYDSEENEVVNPKEYFEKEAELSGSEDWSNDEDERGLDEYDVEEGDADNLDNDLVKSQLEKIYIRRLLDDDVKNVRLIQEILFEDGDLYSDGKGRDRKFKWKNLGTFDNKENKSEKKDELGENSSDEELEEEELRKIRHQKALFLMEEKNKKNNDSDDEIVEETLQTVKITSVKSSCKALLNEEFTENSSKVILHCQTHKPLISCNARGSFLKRNNTFLSKLAKTSSSGNDNVIGPKHSKNFIFATKSPEKVETVKSNSVKRIGNEELDKIREIKKLKLNSRSNDSGVSIVDLLL